MAVRIEDHPAITDLMTRLIKCCHKMEESLTSTIGLKMAEIRCLKVFEEDTLTVSDVARKMELSGTGGTRGMMSPGEDGLCWRLQGR